MIDGPAAESRAETVTSVPKLDFAALNTVKKGAEGECSGLQVGFRPSEPLSRHGAMQQVDEASSVTSQSTHVAGFIKDSLASVLVAKEGANTRAVREEGVAKDSEVGLPPVPGYIRDSLASLLASQDATHGGSQRAYKGPDPPNNVAASAAKARNQSGSSSESKASPRIASPRGKHVYV